MAAGRVAALIGFGAFPKALGHGWITSPAPRTGGNCAHCLNGPQICGDNTANDAYKGPVVTWREGAVVEVTVAVTAHHKGHYEFSICDQVITSSLANPQACLDQHILERASAAEAGIMDCQPGDRRAACQPIDPRHNERFYLPAPGFSPSGGNTHTFYLKLPAGLKCEACTMQWRWWTANSCIPAPDYACFLDVLQSQGYSEASTWGLTNWAVKTCPGGGCDRCSCGEEFRNCVDITIEASGAGGSSPTSTASPPTTPAATTATMTTSSMPPATSTTAAKATCKAVPVNGVTLGATDAKCTEACAVVPAGVWPCRGVQGPCDCSAVATPASSTQPPAVPAPSPSGGSAECKANPGANSGVSDSDCAKCADGYQWWPCNDATLCIGDGC
eukprot:TRINITY_DN2058_c0_g2_i1.p1 TRINITY_DN2058_c0_g2~~TRINITY_DN2058_c0_g2_i1.p1  ORF type:complete len:412 (+),score=41.66 TRINITY_DN2058_c0_g2_i1:74-1237(+)